MMRKLEKVERWITYCDYCKKPIEDGSYTTVKTKVGYNLDFHSYYSNNDCLKKYEAEQKEKKNGKKT
jgi:uncharacterized protein with PIN domain